MDDYAQEGYDACYEGVSRDRNPYDRASSAGNEWDAGYGIALGEIEHDNWYAFAAG